MGVYNGFSGIFYEFLISLCWWVLRTSIVKDEKTPQYINQINQQSLIELPL